MSAASPVEDLFFAALQKPTVEERAAFLDAACAGDAGLRARVERLLAAHPHAARFLEEPAAGTPTRDFPDCGPPAPAEEPGQWVGPYKLLQKLGEGGMGAVWVAEQEQPVKRRVALKLVKPGMDSRQVLARFEAERQALALMDHTHIAKILDGGTTDRGLPFFVMELVDGVTITRYCDERRLTVRQRLGLFAAVCRAVQHAHQKGIIHRDLKPTNVLVAEQDGAPVPKVIDFGVAKALYTKLGERTLHTEVGQLVGTLEYMAPEQADFHQLDVDTRADVYALGALLYELLTGATPLARAEVKGASLSEVLRRIKEVEPPQPSTRLIGSDDTLTILAANRRTEPRKLGAEIRGELDWIVMKALEKDRTRRYETASGLAKDVERFLADEPVEAGPPTAGYRLRKFARKHRTACLVVAAFAGLLVASAAVSTLLAVRATAEKNRADEEAAVAHAVRVFLEEDLLLQASPGLHARPDPDLRMRTVLDRAATRVEGRFADRPLVEAGIRSVLASAYWELGDSAASQAHRDRAYALYLRQLGPENPKTLAEMVELGCAYGEMGRNEDHERVLTKARETSHRVLGPAHPVTLRATTYLAVLATDRGHFDRAESLLRPAIELSRSVLGADDDRTTGLEQALGNVYIARWKGARAMPLFTRLVEVHRRKKGDENPVTLECELGLADCYTRLRDYPRAAESIDRVLAARRSTLGSNHPSTLDAMLRLADVYRVWDRPNQDESLIREVEQALSGSPENRSTLFVKERLAYGYYEQRRYHEAEALVEQVVKWREKFLPEGHPATIHALTLHGRIILKQDRCRDAEPLFVRAAVLCRKHLHPDDYLTETTLAFQGWNLIRLRKFEDAEPPLREALRICVELIPDSFERHGVKCLIGASLAGQGQYEKAEPLLVDGYRKMWEYAGDLPAGEHFYAEAAGWVAQLFEARGNPVEANKWRAEQAKQAQLQVQNAARSQQVK